MADHRYYPVIAMHRELQRRKGNTDYIKKSDELHTENGKEKKHSLFVRFVRWCVVNLLKVLLWPNSR